MSRFGAGFYVDAKAVVSTNIYGKRHERSKVKSCSFPNKFSSSIVYELMLRVPV